MLCTSLADSKAIAMRAAPALLVLLALSACGRSADTTGSAPAAPADAPPSASPQAPAAEPKIEVGRAINLVGNEPFWAVKIRNSTLSYSAPDEEDFTTPPKAPEISERAATWIGERDGRTLRVMLQLAVCQDGMSGMLFPMSAEVEIDGKVLHGCAAYADAMPKPAG